MGNDTQPLTPDWWAELATIDQPGKFQESRASIQRHIDAVTIKTRTEAPRVVLPLGMVHKFSMTGALSSSVKRQFDYEARATQGSLIGPGGKPKRPASTGVSSAPPPVEMLDVSEVLKIAHLEDEAGRWSEAAWAACGGRPAVGDYVPTKALTKPGTGIYAEYIGLNSKGENRKTVKLASLLKTAWMAPAKSPNGRLVSISRAKAQFSEHGYTPVVPHDPSSRLSDNVKPHPKMGNRVGK